MKIKIKDVSLAMIVTESVAKDIFPEMYATTRVQIKTNNKEADTRDKFRGIMMEAAKLACEKKGIEPPFYEEWGKYLRVSYNYIRRARKAKIKYSNVLFLQERVMKRLTIIDQIQEPTISDFALDGSGNNLLR